jgi:hypothetical protein
MGKSLKYNRNIDVWSLIVSHYTKCESFNVLPENVCQSLMVLLKLVLCRTALYCAVQCSAVQCSALVLCSTALCWILPFTAVQHAMRRDRTRREYLHIRFNAVQCSAVQCRAVL